MKKLLVLFLSCGIAAGVFSESKFRIQWTFDLSPNILRLEAPTGDSSKPTVMVAEDDPANPGQKILVEKFNPYYKGNNYEFLTGGGQFGGLAWNRGTENRIRFWWTGESFEVYTRVRADQILSSLTRSSNPSSVGLGSFLNNAFFDDWYIRGQLGMFKAVVGNYDQRGRTEEYIHYHEFLRNRQDFFGVHLPNLRIIPSLVAVGIPFEFLGVSDSTESTNLRSAFKHGSSNYNKDGSNAFWLFEMGFNKLIGIPLFFELFGDMADMSRSQDLNTVSSGWDKLSGGIRISGEKIADLITFDAMYRIRGGDPSSFDGYTTMPDPNNPGDIITNTVNGFTKQPDGTGRWLHHFGLYGNAAQFIKGLGISLGYTGMIRTFESLFQFQHTGFASSEIIPNRTLMFQGPLFNGIDLRANYSGFDRFRITFYHNTSFAAASGTDIEQDSTTKFTIGLWADDGDFGPKIEPDGRITGNVLGKDETQNWLALYNALSLAYEINGKLTSFFHFAYRYGNLTEKSMEADRNPASSTVGGRNKSATKISSRSDIMGTIGVTYLMTNFVTLHGGINLRYITTSTIFEGAYHDQVQVLSQSSTDGTLTFAIPLWVRVQF